MKRTLLLSSFFLIAIISFGQFSDTAQLHTFIRDTIKDRRPNKVTAAQIQKGLLGTSNLLIRKLDTLKNTFNLHSATTNGNETTNDIVVGDMINSSIRLSYDDGAEPYIELKKHTDNSYTFIGPGAIALNQSDGIDMGFSFRSNPAGFVKRIITTEPTANADFLVPNEGGTLATREWVQSTGSHVKNLFDNTIGEYNGGVGETSMQIFPIAANTLNTNHQKIIANFRGFFYTGLAGTYTIKIYFGGQLIATFTNPGFVGAWDITLQITRKSPTAIRVNCIYSSDYPKRSYNSILDYTVNFGISNNIEITGNQTSGGGSGQIYVSLTNGYWQSN